MHAGVLATLLDSAGGYAVLSLLPRGSRVLAVEFKINFTRPAVGERMRVVGRVRRLGRRIAVCELEAFMNEKRKWCLARGDPKRSTALGQMAPIIDTAFNQDASAFRHFNRFYTQKVGVLEEDYLCSPLSLSKVRVLYELAHRQRPLRPRLGKCWG